MHQKKILKMVKVAVVSLIICLVMGWGNPALAQTKVKTLEIIIGSDMGIGLQCKSDSNCKTDEFCHTEQKYCVICKVPPYEWTGTECQCPEGTVEKDGKTCVECLEDEHCKLNYFCDTDTNNCTYCKIPPQLWGKNTCFCPTGAFVQGDTCVCSQPNTIFNETTTECDCILDEKKCTGVNFNAKECLCCPAGQPVYNGEECRTCAQIDSSKPIWDSVAKKCVECQNNTHCGANQQCVNQSCVPCPNNQTRPVNQQSCACPTPPAGKVYFALGNMCYLCLDGQVLKNAKCVTCSSCQKPNATKTGCVDRCGDGQLCRTSQVCPNAKSFEPPQCVSIQSKNNLKKIRGVHNGKLLYISNIKVTAEEAFRLCEGYGMHLATIQEACNKNDMNDSGWSCPNIQGQFPDYAHDDAGDLWLNANITGNPCQLLRVTNSCGDNHYDWTNVPHYALCAD